MSTDAGPPRHVRALLLDALGTLLELEPPVPALRAELAGRGVVIDDAEAGAALVAEITHYRAHHLEEASTAAFAVLGVLGFELVRRFETYVTPWKKEAQGG